MSRGDNNQGSFSGSQSISAYSIALIIILAACLLSWTGIRDKANAFDELIHVTGGVAYWQLNDYRINPENGNLTQRVGGLPLYLTGAYPGIEMPPGRWVHPYQWPLGDQGWFKSGKSHENIRNLSRMAMLVLNGCGLLALFLVSKSLWGPWGGLLSLSLCAFSPNILGHMPLVSSDVLVSWTLLLSVLCYAHLLEKITLTRVLLAGLAAGMVMLSKHSGVVFGPVAILMLVTALLRNRLLKKSGDETAPASASAKTGAGRLVAASLGATGVSFVLVWAAYGFRFSMTNPDLPGAETFTWQSRPDPSLLFSWLYTLKLLPEAFIYGIEYILENGTRTAFLNGVYREGGTPTFFLFCFLYKTTIPAMLLHVSGWAAFVHMIVRRKIRVTPLLAGLVSLLALFIILLVTSPLNIGYRHAYPVLMISFVAAGSLLYLPREHAPAFRWIISLLLFSLPLLAFLNRDNFISYINPIGGGTDAGYRVLRDSSLDWGQDLPAAVDFVEQFQKENPDTPVYFSYFGSADPVAFGLEGTHYLPGIGNHDQEMLVPRLEPGLYVIGASAFVPGYTERDPGMERWFKDKKKEYREPYRELANEDSLKVEDARAILGNKAVGDLIFFERQRFMRLVYALSDVKPDLVINGSVLVFELSGEDFEELGLETPGDR